MPTIATGLKISIANTPQAKDDAYGGLEHFSALLDVLLNDLGGAAKSLYSLSKDLTVEDGGTVTPASMLTAVPIQTITTNLGSTASIVNGMISYSTSGLDYLAEGQTAIDQFSYIIRLANGAFSIAVVTITLTGSNDAPEIRVVGTDSASEGLSETNAGLIASGTLTVFDPDTRDVVDVAVTGLTVGGNGGTGGLSNAALLAMLSLSGNNDNAANGAEHGLGWAFNSGSQAFDYLAAGETLVLTYTLAATDDAAHPLSDTQTVTITITGTNDRPVLVVDASGAVAEDAGVVGGLLSDSGAISFSDLDTTDTHTVSFALNGVIWSGGSLSAAVQAALAAGFSVDSNSWDYNVANSAVQFLDDGETITLTFTVSVTDDSGTANAADSKVVTIVITGSNDAPVLSGSAASPPTGLEDQSYTVTAAQLLAGWTDADNETLSVTGLSASNGTVVANADGSFTITPAPNYNGAITLNYGVTDGTATVAASLSFTLLPVNDAPSGADATLTILEDSSHGFSAADFGFSDAVEGDSLAAVIITSLPSAGSLTLNGAAVVAGQSIAATDIGGLLFTPAPDANGTGYASFTFQVRDNGGTANGGVDTDPSANTITVNVTPVNDAPVATASVSVTTDEDNAYTAAIGATDVDGDALSYSTLSGAGPAHGSVSYNALAGTYTYTPAANYYGADSFTILISDGNGGTAQQVVNVTVNPVNDAPVAAASVSVTTDEDNAYTAAIGASDVDGDMLSYSTLSAASHGTVSYNPVAGTYTYTPAADFYGADSFTILISDGNGGTTQQVVNVTVNPVNDAPVAAASVSVSTDEDNAYTGSIGATDVDGDTLNYSTLSGAGPAHGSVSYNALAGTYTYTPAANYYGADSFTILISDGNGGTAQQVVNVTVNPVNDAPVAAASVSVTTDEDNAYTGSIGASDVDGDPLSYSTLSAASHGTVSYDPVAGTYTYTPAADFYGADSFTILISDGNGGTAQQVVNVTVNPVNDAPVAAASVSVTTDEDNAYTGNIGASDVDGDTLSYATLSGAGPAHGIVSYNQVLGTYTYTPAANYYGADSFTILISDGNGGTTQQVVNVTVNPVNDAPVANTISLGSYHEDGLRLITPGELLAGASDVDGDALTISNLTIASGGGTLYANADGTWYYRPAENSSGPVSFTYTASDGSLSSSGTANLTILPSNDPPFLDLDSGSGGNAANLNYTAGAAAAVIAPGAVVTDVDSPDFGGGYLTVHFAQGGTAGDTLAIRNQGNGAGQIGVSGGNVTYGGVVIGTFSGGTAGTQLTINFNAMATQAAISALLQNITFATSTNDSTDREVHFWISDGDGTANLGYDLNGAVAFIDVTASFVYTTPTVYTGIGDINDHDLDGPPPVIGPVTINDGPGGGTLNGSDLADTILAGNGNDNVYGHGGNDNIRGEGAADISLYGQAGDDIITGGQGGDTIYGGSGNDSLYGFEAPAGATSNNDGGDTIYGGSGSDHIYGQNEDDRIIGGYGADFLTGGAGADRFIYRSNLDTGDLIEDFSRAQGDRIEFQGLGLTAAGFMGAIAQAGAVNAHGFGYMYDAATNTTTIYVDTDGVFGADLEIKLTGNVPLTGSDFVFGP